MSRFLGLAVKRVVTRVGRIEVLVGAAQLDRSKAENPDRMLQLFDTSGIVGVHAGHAHQLLRVLPDILMDIVVGNHQPGGIHHHGEHGRPLHFLRHLFPVLIGRAVTLVGLAVAGLDLRHGPVGPVTPLVDVAVDIHFDHPASFLSQNDPSTPRMGVFSPFPTSP